MVDDVSTINVCPLKVLSKLKIKPSEFNVSNMVVYAYDNSKMKVVEVFKATVKVGLVETEFEFTVLNILVLFSVILGRIWFHPLGGFPSTIHQKMKIPYKNGVVTINAEKDREVIALIVEQLMPSLAGFQIAWIYEDWMDPR